MQLIKLPFLMTRSGVAKIRPAGRMPASGLPTSVIQSAQYLAHFSSVTFPTVDSIATALAAVCLLFTCLPQQHLTASNAIKV